MGMAVAIRPPSFVDVCQALGTRRVGDTRPEEDRLDVGRACGPRECTQAVDAHCVYFALGAIAAGAPLHGRLPGGVSDASPLCTGGT